MVAVVGHWEQSWNVPATEAPMWSLPLRDWGVAEWHMWPVTGIRNGEQRVELVEHHDLESALRSADGSLVFVEPRNPSFPTTMLGVDLPDFDHPHNAVYVFGSAHHNPVAHVGSRFAHEQVVIPTVENAGVLWPHQALSVVLYDRLVKSWQ
jgi:tRNA(Leu) C34 or U34 (ribose-2'-O)-methylase TrmL